MEMNMSTVELSGRSFLNQNDRSLRSYTGRKYHMHTGRTVRKQRSRKLTIMVLIAVVVFLALMFAFGSMTLARDNGADNSYTKYYKTIEIQSGDSLWSIADEYASVGYKSNKEYISEVAAINGLSSEDITAGMNLVVPYYE